MEKRAHTQKSSLPRLSGQSDIDSFTRIKQKYKDWTYIWTVGVSGYDLTILWKLPDSVNLFA
jgi:hypothetical protein